MILSNKHPMTSRVVSAVTLALLAGGVAGAADNASLTAKLKGDYPLAVVGTTGFKFEYNHIVQPGTVLLVRIPGIYADPANTPQAIVNTLIVDGRAQQQRGLLSALSSTAQGRMLDLGEQVYITRIDVKSDTLHFELLTAGAALPRYRAEVRFSIPGLNTMDSAAVEQVIGAALSSGAQGSNTVPADGQAQLPRSASPVRPSRPGVPHHAAAGAAYCGATGPCPRRPFTRGAAGLRHVAHLSRA